MLRFIGPDRIFKPWLAAVVLGAVVALSLLWTRQGLHVSGIFALLCPAPAGAVDDGTCSVTVTGDWIVWMVAGVVAGAFLAGVWRTRGFHVSIERGQGVGPTLRLGHAAAGGFVVGIGAAIARGCTSSIGLTGGALLSLAAFVFLGTFFAGGFTARIFLGRYWR